ncbi:hypothetical protein [Actinoplanes sp. NPDC049265]|uniref:hypothetical protein n=1 Tax=Actinoplanes sp. NPDC049265 TaxID=3363902 RepID=UPI00371A7EC6
MRWAGLYLRSRHVPAALVMAIGGVVLMWSLWSIFSNSRDVGLPMVILTVLVVVAALTTTLGGPDTALELTGSLPVFLRRAAHLLVAFLVVVLPLLITLATEARFGPAGLVVRDAAGLLGLTALGAAAIGPARAWFLPLGWTLAAVMFPHAEPLLGRVLTWPAQAPESTAAAVTAGVLAAAGLIAYAVAGPAKRAAADR